MKYTNKEFGWTREKTNDCTTNHIITPNDGSGVRIVAFLGAGDWNNLPNDNRALQNTDRAVLISGSTLPDYAQKWLNRICSNQKEKAREAFRAMMVDANDFTDWSY